MTKLKFLTEIKTPVMIEVTVKKIFDEQSSEWQGKKTFYRNGVVKWKDEDYYLKFSQKYYPIAVEGNKLNCVRKVINGNPYFELYSGGDGVTPNPQITNESPPLPSNEIVEETPKRSSGDLLGRGASWNNAFLYCMIKEPPKDSETLNQFLDRVEFRAANILPRQQSFVNK